MIGFANSNGVLPVALSATQGVVQAASTTVVYDASEFGCNLVRVYGFDSSTNILVEEWR